MASRSKGRASVTVAPPRSGAPAFSQERALRRAAVLDPSTGEILELDGRSWQGGTPTAYVNTRRNFIPRGPAGGLGATPPGQRLPWSGQRRRVVPSAPFFRSPAPSRVNVKQARSRSAKPIFADRDMRLLMSPRRAWWCIQRAIRKRVLMAIGIAGKDKRRSPGKGGGYSRREESNWRC